MQAGFEIFSITYSGYRNQSGIMIMLLSQKSINERALISRPLIKRGPTTASTSPKRYGWLGMNKDGIVTGIAYVDEFKVNTALLPNHLKACSDHIGVLLKTDTQIREYAGVLHRKIKTLAMDAGYFQLDNAIRDLVPVNVTLHLGRLMKEAVAAQYRMYETRCKDQYYRYTEGYVQDDQFIEGKLPGIQFLH